MSRSYYEWMAAKRKWYDDQQRRRADIPYPTGENIFYQRESNSPYWERRRSIGESIIPSSIDFHFEETTIESFIPNPHNISAVQPQIPTMVTSTLFLYLNNVLY